MPRYYKPDESSIPNSLEDTVQLSQRDVSSQIPINFVTHPAISLSAACFGNKVYEDEATSKCISNLLSIGYQRLVVDLYWSPKRKQWTFCPVAIPPDAVGATENPETAVTSAPSAVLSSGNMDEVQNTSLSTATSQDTTASTSDLNIGRNNWDKRAHGQTLSATVTAAPTSVDSKPLLYNLGSYSCTHTLDLSTLINVIYEYFQQTANTLEARLLYLIFNIHPAADIDNPNDPSNVPIDLLPDPDQLVGSIIDATLGTYMYNPSQLQDERSNLNMTWYNVPGSYHPIAEYFKTNKNQQGIHSTPNGWPCEKYVEIKKAKRLLLGWGAVDDEFKGYNFSGDEDIVFPKDSLTSKVDVEATQEGRIDSGCLYDPDSLDVPRAASWSQSAKISGFQYSSVSDSDMNPLSNLSKNLKFCGISPMVNETLFNVTADEAIGPYQNISHSAWFWAAREPYGPSDGDPEKRYRCAVMNTDTGNWRATDCSHQYYAACRIKNSPYSWVLTKDKTSFDAASESCPEDSAFGVPRTGLEQTYLTALLNKSDIALNLSSDDGASSGIWVNFNSLDVQSCWVTGGPNATCPYYDDDEDNERRQIVIPTVAAIIVLIITALTLFVKCNANRRNSRRKKRVIEGWEYEGVPS